MTAVHTMFHLQISKRFVFFALFYAILAGFHFGYLHLLLYFHASRDEPVRTGLHSALLHNPGLSMVPVESTERRLIHLNPNNPTSLHRYDTMIRNFLLRYTLDVAEGVRMEDCSNRKHDPYSVCHFDLNSGGPCNVGNGFGYSSGKICILLKLNKVYGWVPDPVNRTDDGIRVRCAGREAIDQQLLGPACYFDLRWYREGRVAGSGPCANSRDFGLLDSIYFPYLNMGWYQSPLVFVKFPRIKRHVLIRVKCWVEAKNIHVDVARSEGSIAFELLID
ncbi:ATPase, Na K transporting, beta [Cichlidogyrus casuarinus]|uniref:ATPase, Na K transporting, beta n=1 Tax=Cichlidogyrus casuarinus TaxID=1844966 RepID=A0ABD2PS95_9PLAT